MTVRIGSDDDGRRLDRILRKYLPGLPLSALHRLLRKGAIRLDGQKADASDRVREGTELSLPEMKNAIKTDASGSNEGLSSELKVVFENEHLLIINKEAGTLTHGDNGLDRSVLAYLTGKLSPSLSFIPGPLHRLDRGTSGLIAFSRSIEGARQFSSAIAGRRIGKLYLAVLEGKLITTECWEDTIERDEIKKTSSVSRRESGRRAFTEAIPLAHDGETTLTLIKLGTGLTHQIRVQAASHGHPLFGDRKYGGKAFSGGFFLHAYELSDASDPPETNLMPLLLTAPPPTRFVDFILRRYGKAWADSIAKGLPSVRLLDAIM